MSNVSSIGSMISLTSIILFLFIMWKAFVSFRKSLYSLSMSSSIEWFQLIPPAEHTYSQLPILTD